MQAVLHSSRSRKRHFFLAALSIVLAVWAQWALFTQKYVVDGAILFAAALALLSLTVFPGRRLVQPASANTAAEGRYGYRSTALIAAAAFAFLTFVFSSGNRFRLETVVFWVLAAALFARAFWVSDASPAPPLSLRFSALAKCDLKVPWSLVGLGLVMVVAAFFRYYQIAEIPPEPTSDHAEKLLDIRDVLNGQYSIFFPRNTGRETIQFYMAVPFVRVFGLTHLALKVEQATVSLLTIPLLYLIGKEIGGAKYGLLAAFFLAVSKWDIAIARVGLRFPLYPFFVALAFYFLLRGLRRGRRNDFLVCGLATGAGMYGYSPFRAMALVIPALVLLKVLFDRKLGWHFARSSVENLAVCASAAFVVFIPLGHYMIEHPDMFWFRALSRMSNTETSLPSNPAGVFVSNAVNALGMFNWRGDVVWVNTIPFDPVLDYVSGGLFLLGVGWCLYSIVRHREPVPTYLLVAIAILLLPSILSLSFPGENPSVVRTGGAGPLVALLVAAPVYLVAGRMMEAGSSAWAKSAVLLLLGGLLLLCAQVNYQRYFVDYPVQYSQSAVNSSEIAAVIDAFARSVGSQRAAYVKSFPYWVDTRNVAFHLRNPDWNNVLMTTDDVLRHQPPQGNKLYIIHKDDKEALSAFQRRYANGQLRLQQSQTAGKEFYVFFVPAE